MYKLAQLVTGPDSFGENFKQNLNYLGYLAKHKSNVIGTGITLGVPPITLIKHDFSKFKPSAFKAYREWFFDPEGLNGTKNPENYNDFREAADQHFASEEHHDYKVGKKYGEREELEMIADWYSVYKANAQSNSQEVLEFSDWWIQNRNNTGIQEKLDQETILKIDELASRNMNILQYLYYISFGRNK